MQLEQARGDAAQQAGRLREEAAARIGALDADRTGLREERDRLASDLRAAARRREGTGPARDGRAQPVRRDGPAKRDRMIELAGQRRDLATMPLGEVSKLASAVAAEIGYSPGTARRELVRHVRELQAAPGKPGRRTGSERQTDHRAAGQRARRLGCHPHSALRRQRGR